MKNIIKILFIVFVSIIAVILMPIFAMLIFFLSSTAHSLMQPNPLEPENKYAEFPVKIEYEINGEYNMLEDVLICEYDGYEVVSIGAEKTRKWKDSYKSGNEFLVLMSIDENTTVYYPTGRAEDFMGDYDYDLFGSDYKPFEEIFYGANVKDFNGNLTGYHFMDKDELFEKYKIIILNVEIAKPIINNFN